MTTPGDIICYSSEPDRATRAAQTVADLEQCVVYVLEGIRPDRKFAGTEGTDGACFWSRVYYVSRSRTPRIHVEGLPDPEVIGPPYSAPLCLCEVAPRVVALEREVTV